MFASLLVFGKPPCNKLGGVFIGHLVKIHEIMANLIRNINFFECIQTKMVNKKLTKTLVGMFFYFQNRWIENQ